MIVHICTKTFNSEFIFLIFLIYVGGKGGVVVCCSLGVGRMDGGR